MNRSVFTQMAAHQGRKHALQDWAIAGGITAFTVFIVLGTATALRRDGMAAGPAVAAGCVVGGGVIMAAGAVFDRWRRESRTAGLLPGKGED